MRCRKKGFIRILESILASLILLASLTFFFTIEIRESEWNSIMLKTNAEDALTSIHKSGILNQYVKDDETYGLESEIKKILPKNSDFSLRIKGIPNNKIRIGTTNSLDWSYITNNFPGGGVLNYEPVTGYTRKINLFANDFSSETNIWKSIVESETNILYIRSTGADMAEDINEMNGNIEYLNKFLEDGGTIFWSSPPITTITEENRYLIENIFGLSIGTSAGTAGSFYNPDDINKISYRIRKYYNGISTLGESFDFGSGSTVLVDDKTIVSGSGRSFVEVNNYVSTNGRAVWFMSNDLTSNEIKNLWYAMLMWASGENYKMDTLKKNIPNKYIKIHYFVKEQENYEVGLSLWNLF